MFTGLIEAVCVVKSIRQAADSMQLAVDLQNLANEARIGDSIAINGVCLTVAKLQGRSATFDVSAETLAKSSMSRLKSSSLVNIEFAMKSTGRFGGHFVQGHVDGIAAIEAIDKQGRFANIKFTATPELLEQIVVKGSIAVDGISLTIAEMKDNSFTVALIPETLEKTTLGKAKIGDEVNIEIDIIVKTVKQQLGKILPQKQNLTIEQLKELGF